MKQIHLGGKYGSIIGNYALVDDEDYEWLNKHKWTAKKSGKTFYAERGYWVEYGKLKCVKMHREILKLTDTKILGDHEDGNGLNNQRRNLRKATSQQNCMNRKPYEGASSKYKGVHFDKESRTKKWRAILRLNGTPIHIGRFVMESDAAVAYNEAATKHFGEFAVLNAI